MLCGSFQIVRSSHPCSAVCALSALLIAAPNTAAFAVGEPSGSVTVTQGPAGSYGTVTWDASTKTVRITTVAGTLAGRR